MVDVITREYLDQVPRFYVETSDGEVFEVTKKEEDFFIRDVVPPVVEGPASEYKTVKLEEEQDTESGMLNPQHIGENKGIVKGGHFAFVPKGSDQLIITKGTVKECYQKQQFNHMILKLQMFQPEEHNFPLSEYAQGHFKIKTDRQDFYFIKEDGKITLENKVIKGIFSVYDDEKYYQMSASEATQEINVSPFYMLPQKPFILMMEDQKGELQLAFHKQKIVQITKIGDL